MRIICGGGGGGGGMPHLPTLGSSSASPWHEEVSESDELSVTCVKSCKEQREERPKRVGRPVPEKHADQKKSASVVCQERKATVSAHKRADHI
jgi:hypothetical protein